jgi:HEAT repeat protein
MINFFRDLHIDRPSFWIGFIAGSLIWLVLRRLGPTLRDFWRWLKERITTARTELLVGTEVRHRNDTVNRVQALHLASPLFSLEEIFIEPHFLAPPAPVEPQGSPPRQDITEYVLPFLPDWPRMGSNYGAPTLRFLEALQADSHLIIIGDSGTGKTVALAYLAIQLARHAIDTGPYANRVPFFIHVNELVLTDEQPTTCLAPLQAAISAHASTLTLPKLAGFIANTFEAGRAVLLLDGFDEIPPHVQEETILFLNSLLDEYPDIRVIITASQQLTGLPGLNFYSLVLAPWDIQQRAAFIQRWSARWMKYIVQPDPEGGEDPINPILLNGWLLVDQERFTPLELTLKVWGAYARDIPGPTGRDAIEAYVKRMTVGISEGQKVLEQLAAQMLFTLRSTISRKDAEQFISTQNAPQLSFEQTDDSSNVGNQEISGEEPQASAIPEQRKAGEKTISGSRVLSDLIENGLVISRPDGLLSIVHPIIAAYLAAENIAVPGEGESLVSQPDWTSKDLTLRFLAIHKDIGSWLAPYLNNLSSDLLMKNIFTASRLLTYSPSNAAWTTAIIRNLAGILQNGTYPISLRARAIAALVEANLPGVDTLFRQSQRAKDPIQVQLAALGSGAIRDVKAIAGLTELLGESLPNIRRAACLALVYIGTDAALEAVASALLHADEELRIIAAEALANHPEEGYPILEEGSKMDDVLVRRAVVAGLQRVGQPWAQEILARMRLEDNQWVVQDAATQALEELAQPYSRLPKPVPELSETPWLIAFASERGIGIAPGKPATNLIYLALKEGNEEQQLAALQYLGRCGDQDAILPIYEAYFTSSEEVKDAAYQALWLLDAGGLEIPAPMQFGFNL